MGVDLILPLWTDLVLNWLLILVNRLSASMIILTTRRVKGAIGQKTVAVHAFQYLVQYYEQRRASLFIQ